MQESDIKFQIEPELFDMLRDGPVQHERYDSLVIDDFKKILGIESNKNIKNKKFQIFIRKIINYKYSVDFKFKKYIQNNIYKYSGNN